METRIISNDEGTNMILKSKITFEIPYSNQLYNLRKESLKKEISSTQLMKTFTFTEKQNINKKKEINNLENNSFIFSEEKFGKNIYEIDKNDKKIISFIDIDLLLQRIAIGKNIYRG